MSHAYRRLARLRARIAELGAAGAVITTRENVAYLTGFGGSAGTLVLAPGKAFLLTDSRYEIRAKAQARGVAVVVGKSLTDVVNDLPGRPTLIYEADNVSDSRHQDFLSGIRRGELVAERGLVQGLRAVKDDEEIELLREAVRIADVGWELLQDEIVPGKTELQLADRLEALMKDNGASGPSFETIAASGPNGAIPHHETGDRVLAEGDLVTFDFGAVFRGYHSDITRTVMLGEPTEKQREVYEAVYRAQVEAAECIAPGRSGADAAEKARSIIREAGYDKNFTHGLGHGVGRNVHEQPGVGQGTTFVPGNIVTVEPGIYVEGWGGVRIEDCVLVTRSGHEVLTRAPKPPTPSPPGWRPPEEEGEPA
jgi:Xaa-Pro aminopeptidase